MIRRYCMDKVSAVRPWSSLPKPSPALIVASAEGHRVPTNSSFTRHRRLRAVIHEARQALCESDWTLVQTWVHGNGRNSARQEASCPYLPLLYMAQPPLRCQHWTNVQ